MLFHIRLLIKWLVECFKQVIDCGIIRVLLSLVDSILCKVIS